MKTLAVVLTCAVAVCSFAQAPRLLKLNVKPGRIDRYDLSMDMIGTDGKGSLGAKAKFVQKLLSVGKGEFKWQINFYVPSVYATGTAKGQEVGFKQLDNLKMISVTDARNVTKRVEIDGQSVGTTGTPNVTFSPKPVKVGDKWMSSVTVQNQQIKIEYKLAKYMAQGRKQIAVIEGWYKDAPMIQQKVPVVFWVDSSTGIMTRANADFIFTVQGTSLRLKYMLTLKP